MKTIAILYGGKSGEHEVSLISAASIVSRLDAKKYRLLLIGIKKTGEWLLQSPAALKKALDGATASDGAGTESGGQKGMTGLPSISGGRKVFVAPGAGLLAERSDGGTESLGCDIVFPVLHGTFGEDGTIQGLLECAGLPYVGAGVLGSAIGMDKHVAKELWLREGLPVVDSILVRAADRANPQFMANLSRKIEARFGWPCFVKPSSCGSSVGASKAGNMEALEAALDFALAYDEKVLVEKFISAREIECAVLGNEKPKAFAPGEIVPAHEFYDYEAKYKDPNGAALCVPASISPQQAEAIQALAIKAYRACGLAGMARVDFFIDKRTGDVLLNEVNTIPGFTAISMYPRMCESGGLPYPELLDTLLALAIERFERRATLSFSYKGGE
ncbi:MAG TPA: D-alanine--D-alanine ligase family protein [Rectinemataceae bacterium]|nr:D-alanine--D-alanine ligase family protein [Rectinemataceae bacterium]